MYKIFFIEVIGGEFKRNWNRQFTVSVLPCSCILRIDLVIEEVKDFLS